MRTCEIQRLEKMDFQGEEALNSICTNLSFVGRNMKCFVVTSCTENEGKSSLVMHIMQNLAQRNNDMDQGDVLLWVRSIKSTVAMPTK